MTLEQGKDLAIILGAIVGLGTLIKGVFEYTYQGSQKRAEHFLEMRKRLKENKVFKEICAMLDHDDENLQKVSFSEKRDFLGFFEEVAMMMNSGLIRREVAHYMFGYYAIRCWESHHFWNEVNRTSFYWKVFNDFASQMKNYEKGYKFKTSLSLLNEINQTEM